MGKKKKEKIKRNKETLYPKNSSKKFNDAKNKKKTFAKANNLTETIDNNEINSRKNSQIDTKNYKYSKRNWDNYLKSNNRDNSPELEIKKNKDIVNLESLAVNINNNNNSIVNEFSNKKNINPLTSPGEGITVFTSPYLSAGAPALGETKGLIYF